MNTNKKKALIAIPIFITLILLITQTDIFNNGFYKNCCTFYQSKINGIVESARSTTGGNHLKLRNQEIKYTFATDDLKSEYRYSKLIEKNDSIAKSANNDTLFLYKKNSIKVYPFVLKSFCDKVN